MGAGRPIGRRAGTRCSVHGVSDAPDADAPGLRESQFQALCDTAPDAFVIGDASNRIVYVNNAAEALFGRAGGTMLRQELTLVIPERFHAAHRAALARFVQTGEGTLIGKTVELVALHADGHEIPVELSLGSAGDGGERTVTAVIRDLTARKRTERHASAQLAVTEALAVARSADEAQAGVVAAITGALGWDVGTLWLSGPDGRQTLRSSWRRDESFDGLIEASAGFAFAPGQGMPGAVLELGRPLWEADLRALDAMPRRETALACGLASGLWLPLIADGLCFGVVECFSAEPAPIDPLLLGLLMTVAAQVSEHLHHRIVISKAEAVREQLTADLQRSNTELTSFAQVAAHDLRTPMATVTGFADLLSKRYSDALDGDGREFLQFIVDGARSSTQLLDSLLASARAGARELDRETVHLDSVFEQVRATLHSQVQQSGAQIEVGPLPAVIADRVGVSQVVQNLLANAMKFTPEGVTPVIEVRAEVAGAMVITSVTDNGIGVAPEAADALFEMFRRGESSGDYVGSGIGLAVCAKVVRRHGGRLWVEPGPRGGSRFRFALPAA